MSIITELGHFRLAILGHYHIVITSEIFYAINSWIKQVGCDVCKGVIENYQKEVVKLLCNGKGQSEWAAHEHKHGEKGQFCTGGNFKSAGFRKKERIFRSNLGNVSIKMYQVKCGICDKRFAILLPLLKIAPRSKPTIKVMHMVSETVTDLSYRKGSSRFEWLAEINIPKSTLHRWMTTRDWETLTDAIHTESMWKILNGIMADGTGYKRQQADTTKGNLRLIMGIGEKPKRLIPLCVWADESWEDIEKD